ncbi:MAG TPA: hypothetical protein VK610_08915 [Rhodothermales bacterium]|nr:hypothetical protein [Rhodothermales bacterium]
MATTPIPRDELARRGEALFAERIAALVSGRPADFFVVMDVDSGDFSVDADERVAAGQLRARRPNAQVWLRRVGSRYARHYGSRRAL